MWQWIWNKKRSASRHVPTNKPRGDGSVARENINLQILDMSVFDKFTRFDKKDDISLKKTVFNEIRVKVSVDLAWVAMWKSRWLKNSNLLIRKPKYEGESQSLKDC